MTAKAATVAAVGRVVYGWMLDRGYMVDPDEGDIVAERVEAWDAQDLLYRLSQDGIEVRDTTADPR